VNRRKDLGMGTSDLLPPADVGQEHPRPHDVLQPPAHLLEREPDATQRLPRLRASALAGAAGRKRSAPIPAPGVLHKA